MSVGDAGRRLRAFDWSSHPLGPPATWPQSLRTALRLMLNAPQPMYLWWGPAHYCFCNGAFEALVGSARDLASPGQPGPAAWGDSWDAVAPAVTQVFAGTGPVWDAQVTLPGTGAALANTVSWSCSYTPIDDSQAPNGIGGVLAICTDTTHEIAEEQRRAADAENQRRLFEQTPGFLIILRGPDHIVEFVNDAHRATFSSDDWPGKTIRSAFPPDIAEERYYAALDEVYETGTPFEATGVLTRYRTPAGEEVLRNLTFVYAPLRDDSGRITGIICEGFDVTEKHRAETRHAALAQLADRLRELEDPEAIAFAAAEILGRALNVSRAGYGTIDTQAETITIGRDWNAPGVPSLAGVLHFRDYGSYIDDLKAGRTVVVENADRDPRTAATAQSLKDITAHAFVNMPVTEQGGFVALLFLNHAKPRVWTQPELELMRDVAERTRAAVARREAERALRESESRLRLAIDGARIGTWDWDLRTMRGSWSGRTAEIMGVTLRDDITPEARYALIHPDDRDRVREEAARAVGGGEQFASEYRVQRPDGEIRWVSSRGTVQYDDTGTALRTTGIVRDVTRRRRAQEALKALNETLEQQVADRTAERDRMWRLSGDLMLVVGLRLEIRAVNPAATRLLGYAPRDVLHRRFDRYLHPADRAAVAHALRAVAGGPVRDIAARVRTQDGRWLHFSWSAAPGDREAYVIGRDVTEDVARSEELHRAQDALRQAQKMESLGQLTGGVAHDFNNLLTPILGSLDLLQRKAESPRDRRLIGNALESAERARVLVQRLLAFARRQPLQPGPVDLRALINGMAGLIASTAGPQIAIDVALAEDLPPAQADANQLEMAILNLSVNARDAMPDGGRMTLSAAPVVVGADHAIDLAAGRYIRLAITDTGHGMDAATMARAAEPFFSTKGIGKGTGLGLSMVHGLASQLGGAMLLSSTPALGTTVELFLPIAEGPVVRAEQPRAEAPQAAAGSILLVDDEPAVRTATGEMLADLGYRVAQAPGGQEAIDYLARHDTDILVTDHLMPGMTGTDLARVVRERWPRMRILIVSGYADLDGITPDLPRLAKPFRRDELAASVARL
ncbi:PAS domain-containing protein [Sphingomonas sp. CJ20]